MSQNIQRIMLTTAKFFVSYFYSPYTQDYGSRDGNKCHSCANTMAQPIQLFSI